MSSSTTIGMIWPDTGENLGMFEMANKEKLNTLAGSKQLGFDVAYSKGPEGHSVAALQGVGAIDSIAIAGKLLAARGCDSIVWACTSGSFIGGLDWSLDQRKQLAIAVGKPVTSGSIALISSALRLNYQILDVISPYPDDVTEIFCQYVRDAGLKIGAVRSLHSPGATASAQLSLLEECQSFAAQDPKGDAVLIPDTAVNSLCMIPGLEAALKKPALTVNQACVLEGAALLGKAESLTTLPSFHRYRNCPQEKIL